MTIESLVAGGFLICAVSGFKRNLWFAAGGLAGHGVFDFFLHPFVRKPGVPVWWPGFCGAFDVVAGVLVALLARRSELALTASKRP
jgi:hypothetical protein